MGGPGSGSWYRWDSKETTESQRRIDIRWLKKEDFLRSNAIGSIKWSTGDHPSGSLRFWMSEDRMTLFYRFRRTGEDWTKVEQSIDFDNTPCYLGGLRKWFLCPGCGRRVAVLYGADKYFYCRHCYGLTYSSQQESRPDRLIRKARKIRKRLGGNDITLDAFPDKPLNMHWKTYWRLREEAEQSVNLSLMIVAQRFGVCF